MAKDKRVRNWTFICYPESLPENWLQVLTSFHVTCAVSPLHDADINEKTGLEKKPHYHVFLAFDSTTSFDTVSDITAALKATIPQPVKQAKAMLRYFCHLDDPDKHQYKVEDIKCLNGFEISKYISIGLSEKKAYLAEIVDFIIDNEIVEVVDLVDFARKEHFDDWFEILGSSSFHMLESMITSQRNRKRYNLLQLERQLRSDAKHPDRNGEFLRED